MTLPQFAPAALVTAVGGLLAVLLTVRVIMHRVRTGVNAGDGAGAGLSLLTVTALSLSILYRVLFVH